MSENDLTIRDLERLTGFSSRSIHHYISRGLLTNPEGSGPAARYGREHLLRLKLIERAKESGVKIDKRLQMALDGLSLDEMEQLVALAEGALPADVRRFGEWLMTGDWRPDPRPRRMESLSSRMPSTASMLHSLASEMAPDEAGEAQLAAEPPPAAELRRGIRQRELYDTGRPERWERYRFGDALEIAWKRTGRDPRLEKKVRELIRHAERLFRRDDHEGGDNET